MTVLSDHNVFKNVSLGRSSSSIIWCTILVYNVLLHDTYDFEEWKKYLLWREHKCLPWQYSHFPLEMKACNLLSPVTKLLSITFNSTPQSQTPSPSFKHHKPLWPINTWYTPSSAFVFPTVKTQPYQNLGVPKHNECEPCYGMLKEAFRHLQVPMSNSPNNLTHSPATSTAVASNSVFFFQASKQQ